MINLIHADSGKEIPIDHRKITNIREFKSITSGIFCILTLCRDNGTLIGFLPVRGSWADIKSKIEEDIGREMTLEEWKEYCPDSIIPPFFIYTEKSKAKGNSNDND